jgi:hypothetical protein
LLKHRGLQAATLIVVLTAIVAGVTVAAARPAQRVGSVAARASVARTHAASRAGLSRDAALAISSALGRGESRYWLRRSGEGRWSSASRLGSFALSVSAAGARLSGRAGQWVTFRAPAGASTPRVSRNGASYPAADGSSESFAAGPAGLEQTFSLSRPTGVAPGGELTLPVPTTGTLSPVERDGQVALVSRDGTRQLSYSALTVTDASHRRLSSWLSVRDGHLSIRIDAAGADYPLLVDPTITSNAVLQEVTGTPEILGDSVAVDGATVVVGAPGATVYYGFNSIVQDGQVDVFTEPAGGWSGAVNPVATLQSGQTFATDDSAWQLGTSVAIDGSTIVVGAPNAGTPPQP